MRTEFADLPLPPPGRKDATVSRRDDGPQRRERFALPQEARSEPRREARETGRERDRADRPDGGATRSGTANAQKKDVRADGSPDKTASGKDAIDRKASAETGGKGRERAGAPDGSDPAKDATPGARHRAMGAVSLITLMRTGSVEGKDVESDGDLKTLPEGDAELSGLAELLVDPEAEAVDEAVDEEAVTETGEEEGDLQGDLTGDAVSTRLADEADASASPETEDASGDDAIAQAPSAQAKQGPGEDSEQDETEDTDGEAGDAATSGTRASQRNADPARGELPAQASDAARSALARAPGQAGRHAGAETAVNVSGEPGDAEEAAESGDAEEKSPARSGAESKAGIPERLSAVDQEAARRSGQRPDGPAASGEGAARQAGISEAMIKALEAARSGPTTSGADTAAPQQSQPAIDAAKASAGAQPAQTNGAVLVNTPLSAVPLALGMKAMAGASRFEIRLDPAELGRIDVRLDIDKEGNVKARLTVDRVETLQLLQRDARTLERAFEQAGLKPSEDGIDLSLRDDRGEQSRREARDGAEETGAPAQAGGIEEAGHSEAELLALARETMRVREAMRRALGGVDLSI